MITSHELVHYARSIKSRNEFITFVEHLRLNFLSHSDEWENTDIESFLEALIAFTRDIDGYYKNMGENVDVEKITWRMIAEIFLAAKVYE